MIILGLLIRHSLKDKRVMLLGIVEVITVVVVLRIIIVVVVFNDKVLIILEVG